MARFVEENFVPIRVHARDQREQFKELGERYGALWTPTILVLDQTGEERHRIEGFLPVDELMPQLMLGLAHASFANGKFEEAERRFREVLDGYPNSDSAAEAQYWAGVSRYKAGDASALAETARQFAARYSDTTWAKKASVWSS